MPDLLSSPSISSVSFPEVVIPSDEYVLFQPYSYSLPSEVVQIARDCVVGFSGDYFLFQYDSDEYVLILTDLLESAEGAFNCEGFQFYDIQYVENVQTVSHDISGNLVGFEEGASAQHFSGDYEVSEALPSYFRLYHDEYDDVSLHVSTADHAIIYASLSGYASLHDSSSYFGSATVMLLSGFAVFYLIHSIFNKVK